MTETVLRGRSRVGWVQGPGVTWQSGTEPSLRVVGQGRGLPASRCLPVPDPRQSSAGWPCPGPPTPTPGSTSAPAFCSQALMGRLRVGPGRAASPVTSVPGAPAFSDRFQVLSLVFRDLVIVRAGVASLESARHLETRALTARLHPPGSAETLGQKVLPASHLLGVLR